MKIFAGYGFNARDKWVEEYVFPIIVEAFGDEVITGNELQGDLITDAVREKIRQADALIGFATRRTPMAGNKWTTHRWVTDEIAFALGVKVPVLEVREIGVDDQGGMAGDRQHVAYDETKRDRCLVDIAKAIGKWHRARNAIRLQLMPAEVAYEILPVYRKDEFQCRYRLQINDQETDAKSATLKPIKGGLFIDLKDLPKEAMVQVEIRYQNRMWISAFESIDAVGVTLRRE